MRELAEAGIKTDPKHRGYISKDSYEQSCANAYMFWMVYSDVREKYEKEGFRSLMCAHYGACITDVAACRERYIKDTAVLREVGYTGPIPDFKPSVGR